MLCDKSRVGIVKLHGPATIPLATGTLFRVADRSFIVTAAHAIRDALEEKAGLGLVAISGKIVGLGGSWKCSPLPHDEMDGGLGDIAIFGLAAEQVPLLVGNDFVGLRDMN